MNVLKKWWLWVIAVLAISLIISILYGVGKGVVLEEEKVTYNELQKMIEEKENELDDITKDFNDNKEHYDELQEMSDEYDELLESIVNYKLEVTSLESEIEEGQKELDKIDGEIAKAIDEPIKVNPGTYHFGEDIDEGRYKVTYQEGQRGNIYFRGDEDFAQTFGDGETKEYTFYANEGENIQTDIQALLYPLE